MPTLRVRGTFAALATTVATIIVVPFMATPANAASGLPCGATAVSAGGGHGLAIISGSIYAWGRNDAGQVGDGTTTQRLRAVKLTSPTGITKVSAGDRHSLAIGAGGIVYAWGDNTYGQLGDGTTTMRTAPVQVPGLSGITAVAAGYRSSFALGAGGTVYAWGANTHGVLGDGTTTERHSPVQVTAVTGFSSVSAGQATTYGIKAGQVYMWGDGISGETGDGTNQFDHVTPQAVPGLTGATAVSGGGQYALSLDASTNSHSWGANGYGQLGDGTTTDRNTQAVFTSGLTTLAAGAYHAIAIGANGSVYGWGANDAGQVGDGTTTNRNVPVQVSGLSGITALAAGFEFNYALGAGGAVWAWGYNTYGQLGDGTTTNRATPVQISCVPVAPEISSASASPNPVSAGSATTFSVDWSDLNGDQARALICKTNAVAGGGCTGGAWAIGTLTSSTPATASYTPVTNDIGNRTYYAFACDSTNLCSPSISGTLTVNGTAPTASAATDTPDPVLAGNTVTFTVSWTDPNAGDSVRAVICRTNAVSNGTCSGGAWAVGSQTTTSPSTVSYTTSNADIGTKPYYAFACDFANLCSAGVAGTVTTQSAAPSATSASHSPSQVVAGHEVTFSVNWTDPNPGDTERAVICKTDAISAGGTCLGGAWANGYSSTTSPAWAAYMTQTADIGTHPYYAFVCDSTSTCSNSISGSFVVQPQACSDGIDNDGDGRIDAADAGCSSPEDETEGPTCNPVTTGVIACVTVGSVSGTYYADYVQPTLSDGPHAGLHIDTYEFDVNGTPTAVPCVNGEVDSTYLNPCGIAGGTYVGRTATLYNASVPVPVLATAQLTRINTCNAEVSILVNGLGVESYPITVVC
jgi:alpha-tubulin suppressor-like RCC1 family protein